jgi:hypothetical protein
MPFFTGTWKPCTDVSPGEVCVDREISGGSQKPDYEMPVWQAVPSGSVRDGLGLKFHSERSLDLRDTNRGPNPKIPGNIE